MKNTKLFVQSLLFSALIIVTGCSKEQEQDLAPNDNNNTSHEKVKLRNEKSNSISSSYESFGIIHNAVLEEIADMTAFPNVENSEILIVVSDYVESEIEGFTAPEIYTEPASQTIKDIISNNSLYGSTAIAFAEDLDDLMIAFISDTLVDSAVFVADVKTLEDDIYNSSISAGAKDLLIGTCIIARYSGSFWWDAEYNSSNSWYNSGMDFSLNDVTMTVGYKTPILNGNAGLSGPFSSFLYRLVWDVSVYSHYAQGCENDGDPSVCREIALWSAGRSSGGAF